MIRQINPLLLGLVIIAAMGLLRNERAHAESPRVLEAGKLPADSRLGGQRTYNDAYHSWVPPATKAAWEAARPAIRERMLVGLGLWPMPPKAPLAPMIHGRIESKLPASAKSFRSLPHPSEPA